MWLMGLQILGATEHLSAQAAQAAGVPGDGPVGFLGICTTPGAAPLLADDSDAQGHVAHACALCAMAATAGHAILTATIELPLPLFLRAPDAAVAYAQTTPISEWRYGVVRGPPFASC